MQTGKNIILFLLLSFFLNACSSYVSTPIIFLEPTLAKTTWLHGQEFASKTIENIEVSIAFYRTITNMYIFDVEIKNISDSSVLIEPEFAYYYSLQDKKKDTSEKIFAKNPEHQIELVDKSIAKEKCNYSNEVTADAVFSILDFALTVATITDGKSEDEIDERLEESETMADNRIARDENHEIKIENLTKKRDDWEISALRKTTLVSNSFVQGRLYFQTNNNMEEIKVTIPINNLFFNFVYKINKRYLYRI